jgi:site-specific DNA recombinase
MRYILYARKSSESEDRQVQSVDDQLRVLRDLARRERLTVVAELTESRSAKDPGKRPVFLEMLERVEAGQADGLLCWSVNRLSRNPIDSGKLNWLLQQGVLKSIKTVDREYQSEDNVLLMAVESGVATQYILDLRKAVIRGMEFKAERGWYPGRPPQGYRINPETREIETFEPQFGMLRRAWELLLGGAYTVPEIHQELIRWGYSSSRKANSPQQVPSLSNVYKLFDSPFYYGLFSFRGRLYPGKHRPMVSKAEFDQTQTIIHGPVRIQPQKHEFAFTGLMRCGSCGCMITAERKLKHYKSTARTVFYEYYRCTRRRGPCPEPAVTGAQVEAAIAKALGKVTIDARFGDWLREVIDRDLSGQDSVDGAVAAQQDSSLKARQRKLDQLVEMRLSGEITAEEFGRYRNQHENEMVKLKVEADHAELRHEALRNAIRFGTRDFLLLVRKGARQAYGRAW